MILRKSLSMIPVIIGITSGNFNFENTDVVFDERDVKNNLINLDINPNLFKEAINSMDYDINYFENQIKFLIESWRKETLILSDIHKIIDNNNFKQILSFKYKAVPFLLNELRKESSTLVWALNIILDKKISDSSISIKDASKAWVNWGIKNKLIEA